MYVGLRHLLWKSWYVFTEWKSTFDAVTDVQYMPEQVIDILYYAYVMFFMEFQCEHFVARCMKILFYPVLLCIQESIALFEGFQSSSWPARPSDKSIFRMVSIQYW